MAWYKLRDAEETDEGVVPGRRDPVMERPPGSWWFLRVLHYDGDEPTLFKHVYRRDLATHIGVVLPDGNWCQLAITGRGRQANGASWVLSGDSPHRPTLHPSIDRQNAKGESLWHGYLREGVFVPV